MFDFLISTDQVVGAAYVGRAKTKLQSAANAKEAAIANSGTVSQSLGNRAKVDAAGKQFTAMQGNLARMVDSNTLATSMGMLQMAEQAGAATAQAAAAGIGGSSVESYNQTMRSAAAQKSSLVAGDQRAQLVNYTDNAGALMADAYGGMDRQFIAANIDRTDVGPTSYSPWGDLLALGVASAAAVAGAPQVGKAILDAKASGNFANAGNNQAAAQSLSNATSGFTAGAKSGEFQAVGSSLQSGQFNMSNFFKL
jgi:hypothetical protein